MKKKIKLVLTAQLKDAAGVSAEVVEINEGEKLQEVIRSVGKQYGETFEAILFDENGDYRHSNLIVVNQVQVNFEDEININDGDEITLMSPIAGG
ncbi:MoaD/ThiS family protein [Flagellimonas sp.]|uniref:MoaD/ThiS family protein n=1 Tax=Flagellimonas sp. TaxID=2058762 RepID=UPI003B50BBA4